MKLFFFLLQLQVLLLLHFNIKAAYLSKEVKKKEQAIGLNKNTAVEIPLSGMQNSLYEGVTVSGGDERWYKFNVSERAVINPTFELAEKERCNLFSSESNIYQNI